MLGAFPDDNGIPIILNFQLRITNLTAHGWNLAAVDCCIAILQLIPNSLRCPTHRTCPSCPKLALLQPSHTLCGLPHHSMAPSKSQAPAPNLDPSWMVVPLARFSHATSPKGALKHQWATRVTRNWQVSSLQFWLSFVSSRWIHEPPRDELCLVFRPVRDAVDGSMRSTVRMLVYAGAEVLVSTRKLQAVT